MDSHLHKANLRKRIDGPPAVLEAMPGNVYRLLAASCMSGMSPIVRGITLPVISTSLFDDLLERLNQDGAGNHPRTLWAAASEYRPDLFGFVVDLGRKREYCVALVAEDTSCPELVVITAYQGNVAPATLPDAENAVGWIIW